MGLRLETLKEVKEVFEEFKKKVSASCDEMPGRSARRGGVSGDRRDVLICQLCEIIEYLQEGLKATRKAAEEWSLKEE